MTTVVVMDHGNLVWSREALVDEAATIADEIIEYQRLTPDGGITWVGPTGYGTKLNPLRRRQLPPHLYNGTTGIALFLAALAQLQNGRGDRYRDACMRVVAPLRRKLLELAADSERADRLNIRLGGLIGLGSFIYGLLHIGELLGEPELVREAHSATILITPEKIARDHQVRVQTGTAGALLVLLALYRRIPDPNASGRTLLDLADLCADHLIAERVAFDGCPKAWALSPGKPPLIGFSYGAAGVSYSLLRLHHARPRLEVWQAAQEGLAFVRGLYSPADLGWEDARSLFEFRYRPRQGTWKDWWAFGTLEDLEPRDDSQAADGAPVELPKRLSDMWCHGAVGIALGHLSALDIYDSAEIRAQIDGVLKRAPDWIRALESREHRGADDLCCGAMGKAELLLEAGRKLGDPQALRAAHELVYRVWQRAHCRGRYELSAARGTEVFTPYLFQGIAGIGYTLLRLASPETLPCLLVLE